MENLPAAVASSLEWMDGHGIWDMLTFFSALSISIVLASWRRARLAGVSVFLTYYCDDQDSNYRNVLFFEVRNLLHHPIVLSRPNFRFSKHLRPGASAHGNSATGDYEIKFREIEHTGEVKKGHSFTTLQLNHRGRALAFVPFDDTLSLDAFQQIAQRRTLGVLSVDVVILGDKRPKVALLSVRVRNVMPASRRPWLGVDDDRVAPP